MNVAARLPALVQRLVQRIYDVTVADVRPYLVTDAVLARRCGAAEDAAEETLLVRERAGYMDLSLFLDAALLERLGARDPTRCLDDGNLGDFLLVVEGISHYVYLAWNAGHDRPVRLLELELQAEIDKYVIALYLLRRQGRRGLAGPLHRSLFERIGFRAGLDRERLSRYRDANRYAGKYCRALQGRFALRRRAPGLAAELRRFYRLPQPGKLRHIDAAFAVAG